MDFIAVAVFAAWCARLSQLDLRERRLPNRLTVAGAAVIGLYATATGRGVLALLGGLMLAAVYLAVHLVMPAAFGAGDVKLAVGTGAAAALGGAQVWVWSALFAPVVTAMIGTVLLIRNRGSTAIPHGPAMCAATLAALVAHHL